MRRARVENRNARDGKFKANWEGPYWVKSANAKGAYHLETPRTKRYQELSMSLI
jgi:hypothetical protein